MEAVTWTFPRTAGGTSRTDPGPIAGPFQRLLGLQPGDASRAVLLLAYLFLVMSAYMAARIARDAIFLGTFLAVDLAYVDLASALVIGLVVSAYLSAGRHLSLPNLLVWSLLFYAVNLLVLWYIAEAYNPRWLSPVIYVWVSIFGALAPVQVWTLANHVLTAREAKRAFGLVGSGAILGAVFGALLASQLAGLFGAQSLLVAVAMAMLACVPLVPLIWRQRNALLGTGHTTSEVTTKVRILEGLRTLAESRYLRSIVMLILVANITTSLAGWQFKALAKSFIPETDALAIFFGNYYFYAGLAGLLVQLAVTGRLLRRFGLGPALLVVPVSFVFGSTAVLLWGTATIWAAIALRSCINVLQYSVDKPGVELLYLPVPTAIRNQAKSFIDTVVWRLGDGLAAVSVLGFARGLNWSAVRVSWIVLGLVAAWMTAVLTVRRPYLEVLRANIRDYRLDSERASAALLDRSTTDVLADQLKSSDTQEVLYALSLFEVGREPASHPAIRSLLSHPVADVRRKAVFLLREAQDTSVTADVEALLSDPDLGVRTEAMLYLAEHAGVDPLTRIEEPGRFADYSIRAAVAAFLARPGPAQNIEAARLLLMGLVHETGPAGKHARLEAARLMSHLPDLFEAEHARLLADEDPDVALEALVAIARNPRPRFEPYLLERLADPHLPPEGRREVLVVLARLGTPAAAHVLSEAVLEGDTDIRFRVITALNELHRNHPDLPSDRGMIHTVLAAEIMGHYRSYQLLSLLGEDIDETHPVVAGLRASMQQEVERIFRLLALLYPTHDLDNAWFGVQSSDPVAHDNATEFLDNVLDGGLRRLLLPLVDSAVSAAERGRRASQVLDIGVDDVEQAVAAFLKSDDPWLKACGVYAVGTLDLRSLEPLLDSCLLHDDELLRDTARQVKQGWVQTD